MEVSGCMDAALALSLDRERDLEGLIYRSLIVATVVTPSYEAN